MLREVNSGALTTTFQVSKIPVLLYRVEGAFATAGSTDVWIQLFDSLTLPPSGNTASVPLKSWRAQANFEVNQHDYDGIPCKTACYLALSTTENFYTADVAAGDSFDWYVDIEEYETLAVRPARSSLTSTNQNPAVAQIQLAGNPVRISEVQVTAVGSTQLLYVQLSCTLPVSGTTVPFARSSGITFTSGVPRNIWFGDQGGVDMLSTDISNPTILHNGAYVMLSTTNNVYTAYTGADYTFTVYYFPAANIF